LGESGKVLGEAFKAEAFDGLAEYGSYKILEEDRASFDALRPRRDQSSGSSIDAPPSAYGVLGDAVREGRQGEDHGRESGVAVPQDPQASSGPVGGAPGGVDGGDPPVGNVVAADVSTEGALVPGRHDELSVAEEIAKQLSGFGVVERPTHEIDPAVRQGSAAASPESALGASSSSQHSAGQHTAAGMVSEGQAALGGLGQAAVLPETDKALSRLPVQPSVAEEIAKQLSGSGVAEGPYARDRSR
jgi:hypothetical protein